LAVEQNDRFCFVMSEAQEERTGGYDQYQMRSGASVPRVSPYKKGTTVAKKSAPRHWWAFRHNCRESFQIHAGGKLAETLTGLSEAIPELHILRETKGGVVIATCRNNLGLKPRIRRELDHAR
jgi:hypothetical protein